MKGFFLASLLVLSTTAVWAEDRPSEDSMFGTATAVKTPADTGEEKAQAPSPVGTSKSFLDSAEQNTQIGGTLSSEVDTYFQQGIPFAQSTTSNPNILFLYLDSKLENDNRVFARIRTFYDPTGVSSGNPSATASYTNPYGFGNGTSDNLSTTLQELRISANLDHQVFLTIGRQKVKYGTAKFFNPTDFLNPQPFNFFLPTDERTGVDMVKAQLPVGITNFYAAGVAGNPTTGGQSGGYLRGEAAYNGLGNWLGSGEISLSGWFPKNQAGKGGFDLSQEVGDFDFYVEGAVGQDVSNNWKDAISTGFTWEVKYADRDTNTVSFNGEYFQAGNLSEYGIFAINLAGPGGLNDINFVVTNLFNFMDQSGFSRLDTVCQFTDRISGRVYVSAPWGTVGGTLYFPSEMAQTGARLDVNF
jgi:hypothetical protein